MLADLNNITEISLETLPLVRFLRAFYDTLIQKDQDVDLASLKTYMNDFALSMDIFNPVDYRGSFASGRTTLSDFGLHLTTATLSSGSLANHPLYEPGAGKKYCIFYVIVGVTDAAQSAVNYTFSFQDEDGVVRMTMNWLGGNNPIPIPIFSDHGTADKHFQVDIAGGAGSEVLTFLTCAGKF